MTANQKSQISFASDRPLVIAGPCVAESFQLLDTVCGALTTLTQSLGAQLIFKASFDKANRSARDSFRGPGIETTMVWFNDLKAKYKDLLVLTDVHEVWQVDAVAPTVDVLQIPAFLCRQTDLLLAAAATGRYVNVKKGQFLSPASCAHIVDKAATGTGTPSLSKGVWLTERGSTFGYEDLVVDMRGLQTMAKLAPVIFDITHSTQRPSSQKTTQGMRHAAPLLARAAASSGYLSGFFLEVHSNPSQAQSDAATQLSIEQAHLLLQQIIPIWRQSREWVKIDSSFN